jgi:hypothetical protein
MKANDLISESIRDSANLLKSMTDDMSNDELHWNPPGTAHSVAATYAHAALATDWQLHTVIQGGQPWYEGDWAGRSGVSESQPHQTKEWAKSVRIDREAFEPYTQAVFAAIGDYCDDLSEEALEQTVDMSNIGFGEPSLGWFFSHLVVNHLNQLAGEIAAVKGAQGLTGYSF